MNCNNIIIRKIVALLLFVPCVAFSQPGRGQFGVNYQYYQDTENKEFFIKNAENTFNKTILSSHLKSTKSANNFLDSIYTYHFNSPTDSIVDTKLLFNYDVMGYKSLEAKYIWDKVTNEWLKKYKYEYVNDSMGRINSFIQGEWREFHQIYTNTTPDTSITVDTIYKYYDQKKLDYYYDANGIQLYSTESYTNGDDMWRINIKYSYTNDSLGNKIIETGNSYPFTEHISSRNEYEYDALNNKTSESRYEWQFDIQKWRNIGNYKYEYTYNTNKQITSQLYYYWSFLSNQWNGVFKAEYNYDLTGKRTFHIYYIMDSASNKLLEADKTEYTYNSHNKIALKTNYIWNKTENNWNLNSKDYYCYSIGLSKTTISSLSIIPFRFYPNPALEKVTLEIQDKSVNKAILYNISGQFVESFPIQQGVNTINLKQLPKGLYIIKVQTNDGIGVQKLVIK